MRLAFPVAPLALLTLAAIPATAQETPAEKTAAADVIRRMGELERSLALPPLVARLAGARDPRRDAVIARARDLMDRELLAMADDITRHPETGWKEERSVKILADYLTAHGFAVEMGVAGLKTAFVARYTKGTPGGAGGPNLGIIVEYDALRGTSRDFHGDQHSAQGPVGLAAAVAVSELLTSPKTPGTSTAYGDGTTLSDVPSTSGPQTVSATLLGLSPATIYHFRVDAYNSVGTTDGADQTFKTSACRLTSGGDHGWEVALAHASTQATAARLLLRAPKVVHAKALVERDSCTDYEAAIADLTRKGSAGVLRRAKRLAFHSATLERT